MYVYITFKLCSKILLRVNLSVRLWLRLFAYLVIYAQRRPLHSEELELM